MVIIIYFLLSGPVYISPIIFGAVCYKAIKDVPKSINFYVALLYYNIFIVFISLLVLLDVYPPKITRNSFVLVSPLYSGSTTYDTAPEKVGVHDKVIPVSVFVSFLLLSVYKYNLFAVVSPDARLPPTKIVRPSLIIHIDAPKTATGSHVTISRVV